MQLTPLQLSSYLGSRATGIAPPPPAPVREPNDFATAFRLQRPPELPDVHAHMGKTRGRPNAVALRLVTAYRSDVHATLPVNPQLSQV